MQWTFNWSSGVDVGTHFLSHPFIFLTTWKTKSFQRFKENATSYNNNKKNILCTFNTSVMSQLFNTCSNFITSEFLHFPPPLHLDICQRNELWRRPTSHTQKKVYSNLLNSFHVSVHCTAFKWLFTKTVHFLICKITTKVLNVPLFFFQ